MSLASTPSMGPIPHSASGSSLSSGSEFTCTPFLSAPLASASRPASVSSLSAPSLPAPSALSASSSRVSLAASSRLPASGSSPSSGPEATYVPSDFLAPVIDHNVSLAAAEPSQKKGIVNDILKYCVISYLSHPDVLSFRATSKNNLAVIEELYAKALQKKLASLPEPIARNFINNLNGQMITPSSTAKMIRYMNQILHQFNHNTYQNLDIYNIFSLLTLRRENDNVYNRLAVLEQCTNIVNRTFYHSSNNKLGSSIILFFLKAFDHYLNENHKIAYKTILENPFISKNVLIKNIMDLIAILNKIPNSEKENLNQAMLSRMFAKYELIFLSLFKQVTLTPASSSASVSSLSAAPYLSTPSDLSASISSISLAASIPRPPASGSSLSSGSEFTTPLLSAPSASASSPASGSSLSSGDIKSFENLILFLNELEMPQIKNLSDLISRIINEVIENLPKDATIPSIAQRFVDSIELHRPEAGNIHPAQELNETRNAILIWTIIPAIAEIFKTEAFKAFDFSTKFPYLNYVLNHFKNIPCRKQRLENISQGLGRNLVINNLDSEKIKNLLLDPNLIGFLFDINTLLKNLESEGILQNFLNGLTFENVFDFQNYPVRQPEIFLLKNALSFKQIFNKFLQLQEKFNSIGENNHFLKEFMQSLNNFPLIEPFLIEPYIDPQTTTADINTIRNDSWYLIRLLASSPFLALPARSGAGITALDCRHHNYRHKIHSLPPNLHEVFPDVEVIDLRGQDQLESLPPGLALLPRLRAVHTAGCKILQRNNGRGIPQEFSRSNNPALRNLTEQVAPRTLKGRVRFFASETATVLKSDPDLLKKLITIIVCAAMFYYIISNPRR
jgi:hypothetical protein